LHSYDQLPFTRPAALPEKPYYHAAIEALDTELGRILANVDLAETMVVFLSDNGTPHEVIQPPYDDTHAKGSLTEGGTHVPMVVAGAGVVGTNRMTDAVIHAVDLFATLLEFAGVNLAATLPTNLVFDSRSFAAVLRDEPWNPAENVILLENFGTIIPQGLRGVAARGLRHKLVKLDTGQQAFYDLQSDPYEEANLLGAPPSPSNLTPAQRTAYAGLTNRLAGWHNPPVPPTVTRWEGQGGLLTLTVPEQLGIAYELTRAEFVEATSWLVMTNYVREVLTNAAEITLRDPAPPARAYYRVTATGR
jgi:arylsulfatase A-like enzyme